jgi:leucyl-tRNA synthetase
MIAKLMELANLLMRYRGSSAAGTPEWDEAVRLALLMLAPAAPHITEELWSRRLTAAGERWASIFTQSWPEVDPTAVIEATREVPVQVNGKLRDKVVVPADITDDDLDAVVLASERVKAVLAGREPLKIIHAGGGRLVNLVVREGG